MAKISTPIIVTNLEPSDRMECKKCQWKGNLSELKTDKQYCIFGTDEGSAFIYYRRCPTCKAAMARNSEHEQQGIIPTGDGIFLLPISG